MRAPLTPGEYVWGKFLAVLTSFVGVLLAHMALAAFFNHALPKGDRGDILGPFALINYLRPVLVFEQHELTIDELVGRA